MIENNKSLRYLKIMGIQSWQLKSNARLDNNKAGTIPAQDSWELLEQAVARCTACSLCQGRTQTVFGVGDKQASVMIIGEAPGFYEDKQGEPFVGAAGKLLNAMLKSIGFERSRVYIANILKCRPPNNRDPLPEEVKLCTHFLEKQIGLIQPKLLLAVGRIAAHYLLNNTLALGQLRGKIHSYQNIPLIITYHPAYLLRNPRDKKSAFQDLLLAFDILLALKG